VRRHLCCAASKAIGSGRKFDSEHIQNATIAGGVAIGAACDMLVNPWGALLTGLVAGWVSTYGFTFITPWLRERVGLTDTCGIFNLHLVPGLIGGAASAVAAATNVVIGSERNQFSSAAAREQFPGRFNAPGGERSAALQGAYQMAVCAISLAFAVLTGGLVGWSMRLPLLDAKVDHFYDDEGEWNMPPEVEVGASHTSHTAAASTDVPAHTSTIGGGRGFVVVPVAAAR